MLTQLTVKNLAIVSALELHFDRGMHVITGETGAGKSIIIDALSLALGERASAEQIRAGETQAEITACFDISALPAVQALIDSAIGSTGECILRRIISSDGRSRAYINGVSVTVQQLKDLALHLVQIHSQHQHHALLQSDFQRQLLDVYADHGELVTNVQQLFTQWSNTKRSIEQLSNMQQHVDKLNLLNYQLQELENLNLQTDEITQLDQKHKRLCQSEEILATSNIVTANLTGDDQILDQLHSNITRLTALLKNSPELKPCIDLLQQATISVQEAAQQLDETLSKLDLDPAQLQQIEARLSAIHALARKLRIEPQQLCAQREILAQERDKLATAAEQLEILQQQLIIDESAYKAAAQKLSQSRAKAADRLTAAVITRLQALEMPQAQFVIQCAQDEKTTPAAHGIDNINILVTTNPGQPLALLKKVASGGEMSRISLAIQVITAERMATPTLILDEVDVGISGKTAATVGQLMRELGANAQIVCITHLPQVAAHGHIHFKVEKHQSANSTATVITPLNRTQRVAELARLLGGACVTPEAIANAERLLV